MASEWYCRIMGEEWGPMSTMELVAVARRGRLSRDDQVRRADHDTWVRAELVRGLLNVAPVSKTVTSDRLVAAIKQALPAKRSVRKSVPTQYWVRIDDKTAGPFNSNALRQLAERGTLQPSHMVSRDRVHWIRASRVKGLSFGNARPFEATMSARSAVLLDAPLAGVKSPDTVVIASESVHGALVGSVR
jgi:hypothetical protein